MFGAGCVSASVLGRAPPPASLATTALLQLQEVPGSTPEAAGAAPADPASCALAAAVTASGHGAAATAAAAASFYTQNTPELDAAVALSQLAHSATTLPPPGSAAAAGGAASLPPRQPLSSGGVHT